MTTKEKMILDGKEKYKPIAFDSGGDIWVCGMYVEDYKYYVTNIDLEYLNYCDYKKDLEEFSIDDYEDFPCSYGGIIWSKEVTELTEKEAKIFNALREHLIEKTKDIYIWDEQGEGKND